MALTSYLYYNKDELAFAECPTRAENTNGVKENKVRFFGTPRQIYKTFASQEDDDGQLAMSYDELFKAFTPYNYRKPKDSIASFNEYYQENPE